VIQEIEEVYRLRARLCLEQMVRRSSFSSFWNKKIHGCLFVIYHI